MNTEKIIELIIGKSKIIMNGGTCPYQLEIFSDITFYFRARGIHACLEIYDCHYHSDYLFDDEFLLWENCFIGWEEFDAGYISESEALQSFHSLYWDWRNSW